jgi:hypothetical protein
MKKKNLFIVIIILIAALLIAIVFWVYAKRIELIENKMIHLSLSANVYNSFPFFVRSVSDFCRLQNLDLPLLYG